MIKFSFLSRFDFSSCCGGTLGTQAIVLHEVTGRSDPKINEEMALLL